MKASPHRAAPCGAQPPGSSMNAIPPFAHLCEPAASLEDGHGRTVRYIRLSVTDRCNLRCTYCRSGMETFIPHESVLRYEEMEQLVDMAMDMGVEKVRLTGGEPFARKGFADFLERLRAAHPALDIRVTTNGTLIGPHIQTLKAIGLNAVNLSLDTFDRDKFEQITGRDLFGKVRENMDALLDAGIPFKLNAVAMRGFNDDELPAFIDYAMRHPIDVRFIEFMPMGEGTRWSDSCFWSAPDILDAVKGLVAVAPVEQEQRNGGPARLYTLSGPNGPGLGRLGLISPLSSHFCTSCNRLRITSDGALRTCLFDDREYRLRNALRHPKLGIDFYENLFRELKRLYPALKLHALGAPEVAHIARISSLDDETTLRRLMDAGLDSLPGAGAEILDNGVRRAISPGKPDADRWLSVMRTAHRLGLPTSATMMYGHVETPRQRVEHLIKIRDLQAECPPGRYGFVAFIPWIFRSSGTRLEQEGVDAFFSPLEYLRIIALSRIVLSNIRHIQASWLTVGKQTAQIALHGGADDMGSIMIEENVVSSAGAHNRFDAEGIRRAIREAGFTPRLRDQLYQFRE